MAILNLHHWNEEVGTSGWATCMLGNFNIWTIWHLPKIIGWIVKTPVICRCLLSSRMTATMKMGFSSSTGWYRLGKITKWFIAFDVTGVVTLLEQNWVLPFAKRTLLPKLRITRSFFTRFKSMTQEGLTSSWWKKQHLNTFSLPLQTHKNYQLIQLISYQLVELVDLWQSKSPNVSSAYLGHPNVTLTKSQWLSFH